MSNLIPINEFDIIFISYDEPNADSNWHDLLSKCPWAQRSHGVYGSDAAHKAAALLSTTDRFITVDADNIVDPEFFNQELDMDKIGKDDVLSWAAKDEINGLVYGNGGLKCWPKHVVHNMRTHEAAPINNARAQVDFCWNIHYVQMNNVYSHVLNNASPLQAWRAGFREGCKMTLINGDIVDDIRDIHPKNRQRLLVWQSVGADVVNGVWAMYGARLGCLMTNTNTDWDWKNVRDFKWLNEFWETTVAPEFELPPHINGGKVCDYTGYKWYEDGVVQKSNDLMKEIKSKLGLEITTLSIEASMFFKAAYINPTRSGFLTTEAETE